MQRLYLWSFSFLKTEFSSIGQKMDKKRLLVFMLPLPLTCNKKLRYAKLYYSNLRIPFVLFTAFTESLGAQHTMFVLIYGKFLNEAFTSLALYTSGSARSNGWLLVTGMHTHSRASTHTHRHTRHTTDPWHTCCAAACECVCV